jgi:large repetitive protein
VSPANGASGVATNAVVALQFSKRIDPFTVDGSTFYLYPQDTQIPIAASLAVSADGLTATLTPTGVMQTATAYQVIATNGITDLEGQAISFFEPAFTTGLGTATTGPTAVSVSPPNGAVGVPVNGRVDVQLSAPVSLASVVSGVITLSAGGVPVGGTLSVSSDRMTVAFTPSSLLAVSTSYTVAVSGLTDESGNVMTPFTSAFTTGTSGAANSARPSVSSVSPGNGTTGVSVNSSIALTFNEAIDPTTVNSSAVQVSVSGFSGQLAGSYSSSGNTVTFTPLSPLPGSATIQVQVNFNGVADFSGNLSNSFFSSFTTAAVADTSAPQVVMVTPGNGTTGVGLNAVVTLTFTKSLNASTVNASNFGLLANGSKLGVSTSISADNRVVTLSAGTLPGSSLVTVVATGGVRDLSGNALSNFESSFTTGVADATHAVVVSQRPGNTATSVPVNENVVLYLSEAMNVGTLPGAVHVAQNGVLVSGTVSATENGQVVVFTPAAPLENGALVQVFVEGTAQDVDGNSLSPYQGSFTTAADTSTVAPGVVSTSPSSGVSGIATNVVIDIGFNEALSAATVNGTNVYLTQGFSTVVSSTANLVNGGTAIQIVPNGALAANTLYFFHVTNGVLGTNGQAYAGNSWNFTTGNGADGVAPVIVTVSPPNGSTNVGDNIILDVQFDKPVNPVTVNGSTIQLSGGGTTQVADAISFSNNNQSVVLVPHGPLPDETVMTLTISGVTDVAGNAVAPQTTTFTTGAGPDLTAPAVVSENPYGGESGVPLNAVVELQANEPVDPGSVNGNTLEVQDQTTGQQVAGSYSVSADGRTVSFVPGAALAVNRNYVVFFANRGITDLAGNQVTSTVLSNYSFTTGAAGDTSGPSVVGVSPANGLPGVAINAQVVVQFSEAVDGATLGQVVVRGGSGNVNVVARLVNGNETLVLSPVVPLNTNTAYTVTVAGVRDVSGNALLAPVTTTFTTGAGADLTAPSVVSVSPANGASGVATNAVVALQFSKRIDPLSLTPSTFFVFPTNTGIPIAGALTVSADGLTATITPNAPLSSTATYEVQATTGIVDIEGLPLASFISTFQ